MDAHEKILSLISQKGPVIPADVSKELKINQLFSSALLSELSEDGKIKISHVKIGGSPLYYLVGQEEKLQEYSKKLPEKEQKAFTLLKDNKILADPELDPLYRVTMRQIKDFAKPLQVEVQGEPVIFWKWYLLTNQEAETIIRSKISQLKDQKEIVKSEDNQIEENTNKNISDKSTVVIKQQTLAETSINSNPSTNFSKTKIKSQEDVIKNQVVTNNTIKKSTIKKEIKEGDFFNKLKNHLDSKGIIILESEVVKKNSEIDLIVNIPTQVGHLKYYCKARDKQRVTDTDLSSAYVKGEIKKLPVLFLVTGEFTKKAKDALQNEFKGISTHKIE